MIKFASKPNRSTIGKFLRGLLISLGILVTLTVLLTVFENWSGAREWKKVHSMLVSEGVELDPKALFPELPPPDENFAAIPLIASLSDFHETETDLIYADQEMVDRFRTMSLPDRLNRLRNSEFMPDYSRAVEVDLAAIAEGIQKDGFPAPSGDSSPAQIIRSWMSQFEPELTELDQAARRPRAVLKINVAEDFLSQISTAIPFASDFRNHQLFQAARACAALESGDEKEAMAAVLTMTQISRTVGSAPVLINFLVRVAGHNLTLSVIWQGIKSDSWSAENLRNIETLIAGESDDIFNNLEKAINLEMLIVQIGACDFFKNSTREGIAMMNGAMNNTDGSGIFPEGQVLLLLPNGIFDHNKSFGCQFMFDHFLEPVRNRKFHPLDNHYSTVIKNRNPRNFLTTMTVPAIEMVLVNCFHTATMTEMARAAVAVELIKAETGDLPENYSEIAASIPGAPLFNLTSIAGGSGPQYKREGNSYRLYAPGYNQVDDKGAVVLQPNSSRVDKKKGDWVWKYE